MSLEEQIVYEDSLSERLSYLDHIVSISNNKYLLKCRDWANLFIKEFMKFKYVQSPLIYQVFLDCGDYTNSIELSMYNTFDNRDKSYINMKDSYFLNISNDDELLINLSGLLHPSKYEVDIAVSQDPVEAAKFIRNILYKKDLTFKKK